MLTRPESEGRMTDQQMERAIEFLLNSQAQNTTDIGKLTADAQGLKEVQAHLTSVVASLASQAEGDRQEMREAIDKLILANDVTRDLAEKVARIEIQTSQRVTSIDQRITDLESKL
jgi:hypothetical protein